MKEAPEPSAELEEALSAAADAVYGPGEVDFKKAGLAVQQLLAVDANVIGSASQQLALGTLIVDMSPPEEETGFDDDSLGADVKQLPEKIMSPREGGQTLEQDALTRIAHVLLQRKASERDAVVAYCALRIAQQVPSESGELHAATVARDVVETRAITDTMTRVYSRRVLALVCEDLDDIFTVVRQAQDEGNAFEVVRLVEVGYQRLPFERAMSLLAIGVNAAADMDDGAQELSMLGSLFDCARGRFHELHQASSCDEEFERCREARALAGEFDVLAARFQQEERCEVAYTIVLAEIALSRALLGDTAEAHIALQSLRGIASKAGKLHPSAEVLLQAAEEILTSAPETPPSPNEHRTDPDDDDPTTRADWWNNN